jgi:hypothetical protein
LIFESCQLWGLAEHRHNLARQFDHNPMRTASRLIYENKFKPPTSSAEMSLATVTTNFVLLHQ